MPTTGLLHTRLAIFVQVIVIYVLTLIFFVPIDALAFGGAHFGLGTGAIYLDNVGCTGSEANLTDCSRSSTVSCSSGHSEDAGVRCQGTFQVTDRSWFLRCYELIPYYSHCQWQLYLWRCSSGGRFQSV